MSEADTSVLECPRCGSTGFLLSRNGVIDFGHVDVVGEALLWSMDDEHDGGQTIEVSCSKCDFTAGTWEEFEQKVTLPDPAALLALRDRASS